MKREKEVGVVSMLTTDWRIPDLNPCLFNIFFFAASDILMGLYNILWSGRFETKSG